MDQLITREQYNNMIGSIVTKLADIETGIIYLMQSYIGGNNKITYRLIWRLPFNERMEILRSVIDENEKSERLINLLGRILKSIEYIKRKRDIIAHSSPLWSRHGNYSKIVMKGTKKNPYTIYIVTPELLELTQLEAAVTNSALEVAVDFCALRAKHPRSSIDIANIAHIEMNLDDFGLPEGGFDFLLGHTQIDPFRK